ncbi:MAG: bacillithiol system redox-active protein YtxJ [Candidatus Hydrogenedentes bacterium]|nr:bacillithiol system redox-active protein YtxJ [Candidatus Hydrogenedentota bacterium]
MLTLSHALRAIFGAKLIPESLNMQKLTSLDGWTACLEASRTRPVLVFKHSTSCPISTEAHRQVAAYAESAAESDPPVYMVRVIEERPISNQIADDLGLQHKSPQLILLQDGRPAWNASHYGIQAKAIRDAIPAQT